MAEVILYVQFLQGIENTYGVKVDMTWNTMLAWAINVIILACYTHANIGFALLVKNGIMSKENYPTEKYSCSITV